MRPLLLTSLLYLGAFGEEMITRGNKVPYEKPYVAFMPLYPLERFLTSLEGNQSIERVKLPILIESGKRFGEKGYYLATSYNNHEAPIALNLTLMSMSPSLVIDLRCKQNYPCLLWMSGDFKNNRLGLRMVHELVTKRNPVIHVTTKDE